MIAYEFAPDSNHQPIFRVEIDADNGIVNTNWYYELDEFFERMMGLNNQKDKTDSCQVMNHFKHFWNKFCNDEKNYERPWTIHVVQEEIEQKNKKLYQFLIEE